MNVNGAGYVSVDDIDLGSTDDSIVNHQTNTITNPGDITDE